MRRDPPAGMAGGGGGGGMNGKNVTTRVSSSPLRENVSIPTLLPCSTQSSFDVRARPSSLERGTASNISITSV